MNIKNPYEEGYNTSPSRYFPINKNAFDEGVKAALDAVRPKKFADECPEEGEEILILSHEFGGETEILPFCSSKLNEDNTQYLWLGISFDYWTPLNRLMPLS
jgi:hypothetical protein